jgi:hypothetical protein
VPKTARATPTTLPKAPPSPSDACEVGWFDGARLEIRCMTQFPLSVARRNQVYL